MRKLRLYTQILFFALFAEMLIVYGRTDLPSAFPNAWFLKLNPLVGIATSIASRQVVTSVIWFTVAFIVLTTLFGRFFCGYLCPLGSVIDFWDRWAGKRMRNVKRRPPLFLRRAKYVLLIAVFVLAAMGAIFPLFMDPISLLTRFTALVAQPVAADIQHQTHEFALWAAEKSVGTSHVRSAAPPRFLGTLWPLAVMAIVLAGTFWDRRFWCQYVCPSGALFGLLSRFSILRRRVSNETCNQCGLCATRDCPTRAIPPDDVQKTSMAECILCGVCVDKDKECNSFGLPRAPAANPDVGANLERRHAISGIAVGLATLPLIRNDATAKVAGGKMMRPPGAQPEGTLIDRCIACGQCMRTCPTNAIQPSRLSEGLHRLGTPMIVPRMGHCDPDCNRCGRVCPTEAIRPIALEEKPFVKMGTAFVDRSRCRAWRGWSYSMMCVGFCPYDAITVEVLDYADGTRRMGPRVDDFLCMGCGRCENICPTWNKPAVVTYEFHEHRPAQLPHLNEARKSTIIRGREEIARFKREELPGLLDDIHKRMESGNAPRGHG